MTETSSIVGKRCATFDEIKKQAEKIVHHFNPRKIIMFGSYAAGNPTPSSDVDLLIVTDSDQSSWDTSVEIELILDHTFPVDIIVKSQDELNKRLSLGDFFYEDITKNGKIIYERIG